MITYQDLLEKEAAGEKVLMDFIRSTIRRHKESDQYKTAEAAYEYYCHRNVTISQFQKILYDVIGQAVPDTWSANFKMGCRHFHRFLTQEVQFLLGNGVSWTLDTTADNLGTKKYAFDTQLQKAAKNALWGGVSFGFWNFDHLEVFDILEFIPLYDEENGALRAGIRFWQIDDNKPLRATLYKEEGYTEYVWRPGKDGEIYQPQRTYVVTVQSTEADGDEIYDGRNYPAFPIIPLWGNPEHQSEIVGLREQIDCYDLIKSGFANDVDDASLIYWILNNAGGMDDVDLSKFVMRLKTVKAAVVDDGVKAESHTQDVPYASREALLDRLDKDLYRDAMALDIDRLASGTLTATHIRAAYDALNSKCDDFEYCVCEFVDEILLLVGIDDTPTFTRSMLPNTTEMIQAILQAAQYLDQDYVTRKILDILGDGDKADEMISRMSADEMNNFPNLGEGE